MVVGENIFLMLKATKIQMIDYMKIDKSYNAHLNFKLMEEEITTAKSIHEAIRIMNDWTEVIETDKKKDKNVY